MRRCWGGRLGLPVTQGVPITSAPRPLFRALTVLRLAETPRESIGRRGVMSVLGLVSQSGARFLVNLVAGRLGGPLVLGHVAVAMSAVQLLALVGPTSLGSAASKYMALSLGEDDLGGTRAVARHIWRTTLACALVLGLSGGLIWRIWFDGDWAESLAVAVMTASLSTYTVARGAFFGHRHIGPSGVWDALVGVIGVVGSAALLVVGVHSVLALLPMALGWIIYTWAGWPRGAEGLASAAVRSEINHFVVVTALGTLTSAGFIQASLVVARVVGGTEGSGFYSAALTISAPLSILVGAANSVLFPSMAEALGRSDEGSFRRQLHQSTEVVVVVMSGAIGLLMVLSSPVLALVWGDRFRPAEPLLPVMLGAILAYVTAVPSVSALVTRGAAQARITTAFGVVGAVVGSLVWLGTARSLGVLGVAWGYLASTVVSSGLTVAIAWRREDQRWWGLLARLVVVAAAAAGGWLLPRTGSTLVWHSSLGFLMIWAVVFGSRLRDAATLLAARGRTPSPGATP